MAREAAMAAMKAAAEAEAVERRQNRRRKRRRMTMMMRLLGAGVEARDLKRKRLPRSGLRLLRV